VYEGEIRFGFSTDTYDAEGQPVGLIQSVEPTLADIHKHLPALTGHILQMPPAYSAKKVNGVAAYKLARNDKPVDLQPVEVTVHRFEIQSVCGDRARFVAEVSAGTYVRSLAHDLGQALGCGAHLTELRRTRAGEFLLSTAVTLEELEQFHYTRPAQAPKSPDLAHGAMTDS
jgi:tRNA pseudouridine55 synthase